MIDFGVESARCGKKDGFAGEKQRILEGVALKFPPQDAIICKITETSLKNGGREF